jgi:nicotinamide riboside kinase
MRHYTTKQLEQILAENNITADEFARWIYGQTCPLIEGELAYYKWDVDRFIKNHEKNKRKIFDDFRVVSKPI